MSREPDTTPGLRLMELLDLITRQAKPLALPEVMALRQQLVVAVAVVPQRPDN